MLSDFGDKVITFIIHCCSYPHTSVKGLYLVRPVQKYKQPVPQLNFSATVLYIPLTVNKTGTLTTVMWPWLRTYSYVLVLDGTRSLSHFPSLNYHMAYCILACLSQYSIISGGMMVPYSV